MRVSINVHRSPSQAASSIYFLHKRPTTCLCRYSRTIINLITLKKKQLLRSAWKIADGCLEKQVQLKTSKCKLLNFTGISIHIPSQPESQTDKFTWPWLIDWPNTTLDWKLRWICSERSESVFPSEGEKWTVHSSMSINLYITCRDAYQNQKVSDLQEGSIRNESASKCHCRRLPPVTAWHTPLIIMDKTRACRDTRCPYSKIKLTKLSINNFLDKFLPPSFYKMYIIIY